MHSPCRASGELNAAGSPASGTALHLADKLKHRYANRFEEPQPRFECRWQFRQRHVPSFVGCSANGAQLSVSKLRQFVLRTGAWQWRCPDRRTFAALTRQLEASQYCMANCGFFASPTPIMALGVRAATQMHNNNSAPELCCWQSCQQHNCAAGSVVSSYPHPVEP